SSARVEVLCWAGPLRRGDRRLRNVSLLVAPAEGSGTRRKLMPPSYVKPYVKRQKNDMADAEAICEAVTRPTMRFVETKTPEQQSVLMLHRIRLMLVGQRTMLSNTIRAYMAEFGIVAPIGRRGLDQLLAVLSNLDDERVPA